MTLPIDFVAGFIIGFAAGIIFSLIRIKELSYLVSIRGISKKPIKKEVKIETKKIIINEKKVSKIEKDPFGHYIVYYENGEIENISKDNPIYDFIDKIYRGETP